jgi:hypothetical protein
MNDIYDIFDEYDTGIVVVSDFDIITNGVRVDCITYHVNRDQIGIWAGNPVEDKYAEELILPREERERIFKEILYYL